MASPNGSARLDRIERALELLIDDHEQFRIEHKHLLTAQVVLTDRLDRFIEATKERFLELAEAQKHTDGRLNALITVVDGVVRKRPQ